MMQAIVGTPPFIGVAYLIAFIFFALSLRALSRSPQSLTGIGLGLAGMALASGITLYTHEIANLPPLTMAILVGGGIGFVSTHRIALALAPRLIMGFPGLVGLAAVLTGVGAYINPLPYGMLDAATNAIDPTSGIALMLAIAIGALTLAGSAIAVARYRGSPSFLTLSLLSSCSGWAVAAMGFAFDNIALIAGGALAGAAGASLAWTMRSAGTSIT